jgi:ribosome-associated heat shock protein Hsp15
VKGGNPPPALPGRRLDQWLWFARFVKSRSLAARICTAGVVRVNQVTIKKANQMVRIGDTIAVTQGAFCRTVRVLGLGARRGPAAEARRLYEEIGAPARLSEFNPVWQHLLIAEDEPQNEPYDPPARTSVF